MCVCVCVSCFGTYVWISHTIRLWTNGNRLILSSLFNLCIRVYIFDAKYMAKRVIKRVISIIGFTVCQTNKLKYSTNPLYLFFVRVSSREWETTKQRDSNASPYIEFMDGFHKYACTHTHTHKLILSFFLHFV